MEGRAKTGRTLALLGWFAAASMGLNACARAQCGEERGVESRLRAALGVTSADTVYVIRDFHPTLFPGIGFFRSFHTAGFHTGTRRAGVVVAGGDTVLIRNVQDLSQLWGRLTHNRRLEPLYLQAMLSELLYQTGQLVRGERVIGSGAELPEVYRRSLDPRFDLSRIRPPAVSVSDAGTEIVLFVQGLDGVLEVRASTDESGRGRLGSTLVARAG
jgi:hypothetical protein